MAMFEDLYDAISRWWYWTWPTATGQITAVDVERIRHGNNETWRLAIAYKFWVGEDGPYAGEGFWNPNYFAKKRVLQARDRFHLHEPIAVHFRPDDPSINKPDRGTWRNL